MDIVLDDREVRILGCLIEKEMTTPEYYPLSLNALTNACNQKSNRDPAVSYDEVVVARGLESLLEKGLARKTHAGSRVAKYLHTILDKFDLSKQEMAILCELMLRGPQTVGEIRSHAERISPFGNMEEVEKALAVLMEHDPPLAIMLPRDAGRKECRYMHLFSGASDREKAAHGRRSEAVPPRVEEDERIVRLEEGITELRTELEELKRAFAEFKSQF